MKKTINYDLIVVDGSDKVNLLVQMNPNTEKIDEIMKKNENNSIQNATELFSGTIHSITRSVKSASMFKFTAVSNYTSGDTFTVDGKQVTALLTSGEALGTGAFVIGSEVLCSLKDTLLTIYAQRGVVAIAEDSKKLGGKSPDYYAKQSELDAVKSTSENASSLSRSNSEKVNELNEKCKLTLIGSSNGNLPIDITNYINKYSEFLISVTLGDNPYRITINVPTEELVESELTYQGGSRGSVSTGTVVNVACSKSTIRIAAVIVNDVDVINRSTIRVYARY